MQTYQHLLLIITILLSIFSGCKTSLKGKPSPQNINCGTSGAHPHCYAIAKVWNTTKSITGFKSTFTVVNFSKGNAGQNGLITNEFWLKGHKNGGWIELGYMISAWGRREYFWAFRHPITGIFLKHTIAQVPDEEINTRVTFDIHQVDDGTFSISVRGEKTQFDTTVNNIPLWDAFEGGEVDFGQELGGTNTSAQSPICLFTQNRIYDQSFQDHFLLEEDVIGESIDSPPFGGWMQKPVKGNKGGIFFTYCCAK